MSIALEYVDVARLAAYEKNARTHSKEQIKQLVNSIKEFGFTNPVLIDEGGVLIAGHGRTCAAQKIGMETVPAIRLNGLTDAQKKALRLADNQLALNAGWDYELLADELHDLKLEGFDLPIIGFDDETLAELLGELPELAPAKKKESKPEQDPDLEKKTFLLHHEQLGIVADALMLARKNPLADNDLNDNADGNAIAFICKQWLDHNGGA